MSPFEIRPRGGRPRTHCPHCRAFAGKGATVCPNCDEPLDGTTKLREDGHAGTGRELPAVAPDGDGLAATYRRGSSRAPDVR